MRSVLSVDIRRSFLDFFRDRDHRVVPSSPLVTDDPTLLLTSAGMVPFKPYFLGATPPAPRLASLQKCVRTVDIDNIGRTDRHLTSFEMLGNFSFGDYGKDELIPWAFEFLTDRLGLDPGRLWATVYLDDEEAAVLWQQVGIPPDRIQRLGAEDNFWSTGGPGPCGPSSEVFYDRGPAYGSEGGPAVDTDRYLELWGLVFMRDIRGEGGDDVNIPIVGTLPRPCIDTGLGLDRVAVVLQEVDNVHETDVTAPTLDLLAELAGQDIRQSGLRRSGRIVADHVRTAAFLLSDGVLPANDGSGFVLRRLVRRAVRHARLLGITEPVLADLAVPVVDQLGDVWPELAQHRGLIDQALRHEEEAFGRTLRQGARLLEGAIARSREQVSSRPLSGDAAFELHDTFGFPVELTVEIAAEAGIPVDTDRFTQLMDAQRRRAQQARGTSRAGDSGTEAYQRLRARSGPTAFVGHDCLVAEALVQGVLAAGGEVAEIRVGERAEVVLDRTPFYAQSGGQVGDTGVLRTDDGAEARVLDTTTGADGLHVHTVELVRGELRTGHRVEASVDGGRRAATARSHTATHVLHAVLRETLGDHAHQHGSLVAPGRLRFDFTHFSGLEPEQLTVLEQTVNARLLDDPEVRSWEASKAEALEAGAMALFGETYGDVVRIVDIGDFSRELCGGTHVGHGSQAGPVRLVGEASVGSGVRRLEALTGLDALRYADHERDLLEQVGALLGVGTSAQVVDRLRDRLDALAHAERELGRHRRREIAALAVTFAERRRDEAGRWVVAGRLAEDEARRVDDLRFLVEQVLAHCPVDRPGGVVLGVVRSGKAQVVLAVNEAFDAVGVSARELLAPAGRAIGGGAGGIGRLAHAGGRGVAQVDAAVASTAARIVEA